MIGGPRLPAVLQTAWWFFGRFGFARACHRWYGRCFRIRLLAFGEVVVVSDPEAMRALLSDEDRLAAGRANEFGGLIRELAGEETILLSDGGRHARLRSVLEPALDAVLGRAEEQARLAVRRSIASWPRGRRFALLPHLERISLDVYASVVLGVEEGRRESAIEVLSEWTSSWNDPQVVLPVLRARRGLRRRWARFVAARAAVRRLIVSEVVRMRTNGSGDGSVAAGLLECDLSAAELRDQLFTLLAVGHPPTANALAWAMEMLLRNPAAGSRLRAELAAGETSYLDAFIAETLRIRPVGQWMARRVLRPVDICGGTLTAGSLVVPNSFLAHHDAALHPEPESFRPARFLAGSGEAGACISFGHGPRACPGQDLAIIQLRALLREVAPVLDLRPARAASERLVPDGLSLVPKHGVPTVAFDRVDVT